MRILIYKDTKILAQTDMGDERRNAATPSDPHRTAPSHKDSGPPGETPDLHQQTLASVKP